MKAKFVGGDRGFEIENYYFGLGVREKKKKEREGVSEEASEFFFVAFTTEYGLFPVLSLLLASSRLPGFLRTSHGHIVAI